MWPWQQGLFLSSLGDSGEQSRLKSTGGRFQCELMGFSHLLPFLLHSSSWAMIKGQPSSLVVGMEPTEKSPFHKLDALLELWGRSGVGFVQAGWRSSGERCHPMFRNDPGIRQPPSPARIPGSFVLGSPASSA